jgi:peptidoglycan/xylan/chitin deacetylase (PgdA/CDA1 family)
MAREDALSAWRPPLFVQASLAWHVAAGAATVLAPSIWPAAATAILLNQAVILVAGLCPRSRLLGNNVRSMSAAAAGRAEIALTFDDGPDPRTTPAVLEILETRRARATFFCIAEKAERHPRLIHEIVERGHLVENHTFGHPYLFTLYGPGRLRREVHRGQARLEQLTGRRPRLFRPPAGMRSFLLDHLLATTGLTLVSWSTRGYDAVSRDSKKVFSRLALGVQAGGILLLHDGSVSGRGNGVILDVLPRLLELIEERGLTPVPLAPDVLHDGNRSGAGLEE